MTHDLAWAVAEMVRNPGQEYTSGDAVLLRYKSSCPQCAMGWFEMLADESESWQTAEFDYYDETSTNWRKVKP